MYKSFAGKTNIKKEINKRMRRVLGDKHDNADDGRENMMPGLPNADPAGYAGLDEEEAKVPEQADADKNQ